MSGPASTARIVKLNVFSCLGGYVVSPACMLASEEAWRRHGPISALTGTLESRKLPLELRSSIERTLDAEPFADVTKSQAASFEGLIEANVGS